MSEEQLKAFLEKVQGDTSLQEKLKAAADADAVTAIVREAGFVISADDLKQALSDKELEGAVGGKSGWGRTPHTWYCTEKSGGIGCGGVEGWSILVCK